MTTAQILFDRLAYVDKLKTTGMGEDTARTHADADQALRDAVASRVDLVRIEGKITAIEAKLDRHDVEFQVHRWLFGAMLMLQLGTLGAVLTLFGRLAK
jgi:hypothetical protein